jgi:Uma2 family endonuclease
VASTPALDAGARRKGVVGIAPKNYTVLVVAVALRDDLIEEDQRVILRGMPWQTFEAMLALRGDASGVRMYYLDGEIELVSPTKIHEDRKTKLARLLELWALETDVDLNGFGSWTLKKELKEAGAEPDECYIVGSPENCDFPDLAIEVEWSRKTGLPKEEIYLRLGVRELWTLKANGELVVRTAEGGQWLTTGTSGLLPQLDLVWLLRFLDIEPQSAAVRALRDALRLPGIS